MGEELQVKINEYLPLRDVVFNTLRQGILTGELKPGERLMEIHLANRLGVSRTPIREAIHKLELEGLVTIIPRKGAEVAQISKKNLQDVLEVRSCLEGLAVSLACDRMTESELEELKKAEEKLERCCEGFDTKETAKADVNFHDIILESARNDRLMQLICNLSEQMYRYRLEYIKDKSHYPQMIEDHGEIIRCIERKDKENAEKAIRVHIDHQEHTIINQLEL